MSVRSDVIYGAIRIMLAAALLAGMITITGVAALFWLVW